MALISCPECEKQVSSAALSCPHCGFPFSAKTVPEARPPLPSAETQSAKGPPRVQGSKDKPIQIGSGTWHGVELHATSAINNLFKTEGWQRIAVEGDLAGLCCWKVRLPDGSTDAVWFDYSPAADWIKRRERGEVEGMVTIDPKTKEQLARSLRTGMEEIDSRSAVDAAKQILQRLNNLRTHGYATGKAVALVGGWRNEYHVSKGGQDMVLKFDMRPTLKHVAPSELAIVTMIAATPDAEEALNRMSAISTPPPKSGCLGVVVLVILVALSLFILAKA